MGGAKYSSWLRAIDMEASRLGLNHSAVSSRGASHAGEKWTRKCRRFKVGSRKDYQTSIRQALLTLGLCETSSDAFDFYWGEVYQAEAFLPTQLKPHAAVNSIPGFRASFGDKIAFARLHDGCLDERARRLRAAAEEGEQQQQQPQQQGGQAQEPPEPQGEQAQAMAQARGDPMFCEWTKRSFNLELGARGELLEGEVAALRSHARAIVATNEFPQLWILKPQQSFNQIGISMLYLDEADASSDGAMERWLHAAVPQGQGVWTLQEYVMHPLLYRRRKFDLRVWALVTSLEPLRVYMLATAFPKVSSVEYSADAAVVGRHCLSRPQCACMHVRMPGGDGCVPSHLPTPYPSSTAARVFNLGLDYGPQFRGRGDPAQDATLWAREVVPQIERITAWAILLARREPLRLHREQAGQLAQLSGLGLGGSSSRQGQGLRRFLLLSPDFIVDAWGRAWLEEMNTNGFMVGDDTLYKSQQDTVDAMRVLGADGWPKRQLYEGRAAKLVGGFVAAQGFDGHDEAIVRPPLMQLIHEEAAAYPTSWYRVFPPKLAGTPAARQMEALVATLPDADRLTDLDETTADFLRWRLEHYAGFEAE